MSKITIEIDREKALDLSTWIQQGMFDAIRADEDIDGIGWVRYWINLASRLEEVKDE